jgi:transcription elongation factor Elf1
MSDRAQRERLKVTLNAKTTNATCPFCGHNDWTVGDASAAVQAHPNPGEDFVVGQGWEAILIMCNGCGFIRLHHVPTLES